MSVLIAKTSAKKRILFHYTNAGYAVLKQQKYNKPQTVRAAETLGSDQMKANICDKVSSADLNRRTRTAPDKCWQKSFQHETPGISCTEIYSLGFFYLKETQKNLSDISEPLRDSISALLQWPLLPVDLRGWKTPHILTQLTSLVSGGRCTWTLTVRGEYRPSLAVLTTTRAAWVSAVRRSRSTKWRHTSINSQWFAFLWCIIHYMNSLGCFSVTLLIFRSPGMFDYTILLYFTLSLLQ